MRVIMLEVFQGRDISGILVRENVSVPVLVKGEEYRVDDSLGVWLVENGKATAIVEEKLIEKPVEQPEIIEVSEQPKRGKR